MSQGTFIYKLSGDRFFLLSKLIPNTGELCLSFLGKVLFLVALDMESRALHFLRQDLLLPRQTLKPCFTSCSGFQVVRMTGLGQGLHSAGVNKPPNTTRPPDTILREVL